jgi:hypothetical protein
VDTAEKRRARAFAERLTKKAQDPERVSERQADRLIEAINRETPPEEQETPAYSGREFRRRFEAEHPALSSLSERRMREMAVESPRPAAYRSTGSEADRRRWHRIVRIRYAARTPGLTAQQRTAALLRDQEVTPYLVQMASECPDVCRVLGAGAPEDVEQALLRLVGKRGWVTAAALGKAMGVTRQAVDHLYERAGDRIIHETQARGREQALREAQEMVAQWMRLEGAETGESADQVQAEAREVAEWLVGEGAYDDESDDYAEDPRQLEWDRIGIREDVGWGSDPEPYLD